MAGIKPAAKPAAVAPATKKPATVAPAAETAEKKPRGNFGPRERPADAPVKPTDLDYANARLAVVQAQHDLQVLDSNEHYNSEVAKGKMAAVTEKLEKAQAAVDALDEDTPKPAAKAKK